MKPERERKRIIERLTKMALNESNDAVKLAFLKAEDDAGSIDGLDMTMLSEIKRSPNGAVELKLVNRLEVMKLLLDELQPNTAGGAAEFLRALDRPAGSAE